MRSPQLYENRSSMTFIIAIVLAAWLALVFVLCADGAFVRPPGALPVPILIEVTVAFIAFLAAFWLFRAFHDFVLAIDVRLMSGGGVLTLGVGLLKRT